MWTVVTDEARPRTFVRELGRVTPVSSTEAWRGHAAAAYAAGADERLGQLTAAEQEAEEARAEARRVGPYHDGSALS